MSSYEKALEEEKSYLRQTIAVINNELKIEQAQMQSRRGSVLDAKVEMWENTGHSADFTQLTEANQYLMEVKTQTLGYQSTEKKVKNYERMLGDPYFGRFDFIEAGFDEREKIYIGLSSVIDSSTRDIYVYDWRAPVSGIFYRFEPGQAAYAASSGEISGEVLLKRQYKIRKGKLEYFFDCSIRINDEILQDVLSRNASAKMRNIVETIQKEQDEIIRDTENELLVVQGVAGSGKTSVALHRIAFLLYEGMKGGLTSANILILSPNSAFSDYISNVLPELGEENVLQLTLGQIADICLKNNPAYAGLEFETRAEQLERQIRFQHDEAGILQSAMIQFKGSKGFLTVLKRFLWYVEHQWLDFRDVYYEGKVLETGPELKDLFLHDQVGMPVAKRLTRIAKRIMEKSHPLQKERLKKIERIVQRSEGHDLEIKSFSRLLAIKEIRKLTNQVQRFSQVNSLSLYRLLWEKPGLFRKMAQGLDLPEQWAEMAAWTAERLSSGMISYEDLAPLVYLEIKTEGIHTFSFIKQVVIDEAQDYYPLHYEIFKLLFRAAKFTVLGDVSQSVEKTQGLAFYDEVIESFSQKKTTVLRLSKSYRSSHEISAFAGRFLDKKQDLIAFERYESEPQVFCALTPEQMAEKVVADVKKYWEEDYDTVAILCKTGEETENLREVIKGDLPVQSPYRQTGGGEKEVSLMPVYLAKGLEFDAVLVYGVSDDNYRTDLDRKLLYIASTRALHQLAFYYSGEKSRWL